MFTTADTQIPGSGVGPQSGGFSPTPGEAMYSQLRQQSSQQFMQYSIQADPRTRATTGMLARGLAGDAASAAELLKTTTGAAIRDLSALITQSGLIPGGNPANLAAATERMAATQGFRLSGNVGAGSQIFGQGAITDMLSRQIFDQMKNNFFDPISGLSKRSLSGLDLTGFGNAVNQLTSRGAFAGMNIADVNYYANASQIDAARASALKEGGQEDFVKQLDDLKSTTGSGFASKINKAQMKKVNEMFNSYASVLRDAKEVFGDLDSGSLTQAAEALIGTSVTEAGALDHARSRMANIRAVAGAHGMDAGALANNVINTAGAVKNQLMQTAIGDAKNQQPYMTAFALDSSTRRIAASMVGGAVNSSIHGAAANAAYVVDESSNGRYARSFDQQQIQASMVAGTSRILREGNNKYVGLAAYLTDRGLLTGTAFDNVRKLMGQWSSAGNAQESSKIALMIRDAISSSGINANEILKNNSFEEIMARTSLSGITGLTDAAHTQYNERSLTSLVQLNKEGLGQGLLNTDIKRKAFFGLMKGLNAPTLNKLHGAMNADGSVDASKLNKILKEDPSITKAMSADSILASLKTLGGTSSQFSTLTNLFKSMSFNADIVSTMDRQEGDTRAMGNYLRDISFGGEKLSQEDFSTQLVRGFFGQGKISDRALIQTAQSLGSKGLVKLGLNNKLNGLSIKGSDINSLAGIVSEADLNKLYSQFKVKSGDVDALAKAMSVDSAGLAALQPMLNGAAITASNGSLNILGGKAAAEITSEAERQAIVAQAKRLMGESYTPSNSLTTSEDRAAFDAKLSEDLLGDKRHIKDLVNNAAASGYGGVEFEALAAQYKKDPMLRELLSSWESDYRDKAKGWHLNPFGNSANEDLNEANKIRNLRNKIDVQSGGSKFLGVLEIASDSLAQLKLYQSQ